MVRVLGFVFGEEDAVEEEGGEGGAGAELGGWLDDCLGS